MGIVNVIVQSGKKKKCCRHTERQLQQTISYSEMKTIPICGQRKMPKNELNKEELKVRILKLKNRLHSDGNWYADPKGFAHKYLNEVLDIIDEYRY